MALPNAGPTDCSSGLSARVFNNLRYDNPWQASQSGVAVGALCCPTVPNGFGYRCSAITTGITGNVEPTWPLVLTNTVVDGGVTWTAQDVANPSGKAHPPAGQFGYVFTAADLDGFRLLAYDTAKAVADDIGGGPDYCMLAATTAAGQSIASATTTVVIFGTVETDTDLAYNSGTGVFTVPTGKGGHYQVNSEVTWSAATATNIRIEIFVNGVSKRSTTMINSANGQSQSLSAIVQASAGQTIDVRVTQNSGAPVVLIADALRNFLTLSRLLGS